MEEQLERCQGAFADAGETRGKAKDLSDDAAAAYRSVSEQEMATVLAQHLKAGEPCPVCHRVVEAPPEVDKHIAEELIGVENAWKLAQKELEEASEAETKARSARDGAQLLLDQARDALTAAIGEDEGVERLREKVAEAETAARSRDERLAQLQDQVETARKALSQAEVNAATLKSSVTDKTSVKEHLDEDCKQLQDRLATETAVLTARFGKTIPSNAGEQLRRRREALQEVQKIIDEAQQALNKTQIALQEANRAVNEVQRRSSELDSAIAALRARCEATDETMAATLTRIELGDRKPTLPRALEEREGHVGALVDWCGGAKEVLTGADRRCEESQDELEHELVALIGSHEIELSADETPLEAVENAERCAREEMIRCQEAARQTAERLQQREHLTASIAEKQSEIQLLRALGNELRQDRFVQFIIQQTLDLLAVRASDELMRISAERYSLNSHDGEFYVTDHVNADEERSVKTLSGGETFLASLSLALALSQHVGDLATEGLGAKLEAVFIDEGFGALDPETLEDVIDALERLREGNLMVGVISHVPALAERIRVGVRIEKGRNQSEVVLAASD
jgi:exonuclease SbcC